MKLLPAHAVGPVRTLQVFPALSLKPMMLTGSPFQEGWLETNATKVEEPVVLKAAEVWVVSGVALI